MVISPALAGNSCLVTSPQHGCAANPFDCLAPRHVMQRDLRFENWYRLLSKRRAARWQPVLCRACRSAAGRLMPQAGSLP